MKKVIKYLIPVALGVAVVLMILTSKGAFVKTGKGLISDLCDAFFVSGAILTGVGALIFVTNGGAFDMLAFGVRKLFDLFKKDLTKVKYRTFYDYRQAQKEKNRSFIHLLLIGVAFLLVSIVFFIIYNQY